MSTKVAICDGDTVNIVGVDVICGKLKSGSGVVLVAPSLSTCFAAADAVNRVCIVILEHPGALCHPHSLAGVLICQREVGQLALGSVMFRYATLIHSLVPQCLVSSSHLLVDIRGLQPVHARQCL